MVNVGQNWRLDCNKSRHSEAVLVPGRSIDTVSFCGWAPCHAEDALCENTSCKMPSSRMGNFLVMSSYLQNIISKHASVRSILKVNSYNLYYFECAHFFPDTSGKVGVLAAFRSRLHSGGGKRELKIAGWGGWAIFETQQKWFPPTHSLR